MNFTLRYHGKNSTFPMQIERQKSEDVIFEIFSTCLASQFYFNESPKVFPSLFIFNVSFSHFNIEIDSMISIRDFYKLAVEAETSEQIGNKPDFNLDDSIQKILAEAISRRKKNIENSKKNVREICQGLIYLGINPKINILSPNLIETKYNYIISIFKQDSNKDSINDFVIKYVETNIHLLRCFNEEELAEIDLKLKASDFIINEQFTNFSPMIICYIKNMNNLKLLPKDRPSMQKIKEAVEDFEYKHPVHYYGGKASDYAFNIWLYIRSAEIFFEAYKDIIELLTDIYLHINPEANQHSSNQGCYIATSVYGSYDCQEVWILRRYRDYHLRKTFLGNLFVKIYYAFSPKIVKKFGRYKFFNDICKKMLNAKISKLRNQGYLDTPYCD